MRSRTTNWFEIGVKYEKTLEDGRQGKVSEQYVVDALSFTEAETSIVEELSAYISGEFTIAKIAKATYGEVFFSDKETDDNFFKVKLNFITIDEKTEKEKRTLVTYLVQAHSLPQAVTYIQDVMSNTMIDYVISAIQETKIMDVFEHNAAKSTPKAEVNDVPEYEANDKAVQDASNKPE